MIAATLLAQVLLRNPLLWDDAIDEAFAAAFYYSNEHVGRSQFGYFEQTGVERALLHTWSLSVEEQFYLAWPLLLTTLVGRRIRTAGALIGVLAAASLLVSAALTLDGSPMAYLSAASRAWEFLLGAMLALPVGSRPADDGRSSRFALPALGVIAIVASAALLDESSGFPFPTAVIPVVGTAMLIRAQVHPASHLGIALAFRPVQTLGRLSYSWYLWHWPILVLGSELSGRSDLPTTVTLALAALGPAAISYHLIENPVRRLRPRSLPELALVGLVAPTLLLGAALVSASFHEARTFGPPEALALQSARDDWPANMAICALPDPELLEQVCLGGDTRSTTSMLLLGDSHAAQWAAPLRSVGERRGFRVVSLHQGNCPAIVLAEYSPSTATCDRLVDELDVVLDHFDPTTVVVSHADVYGEHQPGDWERGLRRLAERLEADGRSLLVIHDTPRFPADPVMCLVAAGPTNPAADSECSVGRDVIERRADPVRSAERRVVASGSNVIGWDPMDFICEPTTCSARRGDQVIFIDAHHITVEFSLTLADELEPSVVQAVGLAAGER